MTTRAGGGNWQQHSRHTDPRDHTLSTSLEVPLARRLAAEALGTGLLVAVVVGSGIAAAKLSPGDVGLQLLENALATAAGLAVIILLVSPVSSAHINPVVSIADWWIGRRRGSGLRPAHVGAYIVAQIVGAVLGAILANLIWPRWRYRSRGRCLHRRGVQTLLKAWRHGNRKDVGWHRFPRSPPEHCSCCQRDKRREMAITNSI